LGEKQPDVYSAITHITDGIYHSIKIVRKFSIIQLYVDGIMINLEGENTNLKKSEKKSFLAQRRLRIGNFKNVSLWNGILAGRFLSDVRVKRIAKHLYLCDYYCLEKKKERRFIRCRVNRLISRIVFDDDVFFKSDYP
jgi:hypothetical protein